MSSASTMTISLQTSSSSKPRDIDQPRENSASGNDRTNHGFGAALGQAQSTQEPKSGNALPQEDAMPSQHTSLENSVDVSHDDLQTQQAGALTLVTSTSSKTTVSDESLIAFMQDQGFSRADMAQLLVGKTSEASSKTGLTSDWLKLKAGDGLDEPKIVDLNPANLAEALAAQLLEPKSPAKSAAIIELLAVKQIPQVAKLNITSDVGDQMSIKLTDLLPSLAKKPMPGGSQGGGSFAESGAFSADQSDTRSLLDSAQGSQTKEFREFLAEHLKRAESLRELTDKLGTMVARQIAGQIGRGRWSLEIAMHPAELGSIEVEMEMTERGLEASFRASHSVTRDLLMESMPRLKTWFEEGGIDVAYTGLTQDSDAQNGGNSTGEQTKSAQSEIQSTEADESSEITENQLVGDGSVRLDIRV